MKALAQANARGAEMLTRLEELNADLEREKKRAEAYLNLANVAIVAVGPSGSIVLMNKYGCQVLGCNKDNLLGRDWFGTCIPDDHRHEARAVFKRLMAGEVEQVEYHENEIVTRSGEKRQFAWHNTVVRDDNGHIVATLSAGEDITRRKIAEAALATAQAELVKHEKLATLGQVAGSVAHEIRNPLGAIRNAAYFLNLTVSDKLTGKAAKHLEIINDEINRCNRIITSMLDFVQGRTCEPHACSLAEILSQATAQAELPRITEVETRLPDNLPFVRVDAGQMEQVFCNLITNANQAMADGGKVTIAAARTNGVVRVAVSDSGSGITPENMARLFEPLFSTKAFGVGLGLAICKSFIEANKGTIGVETEVGKGTTVTVTLPTAA